MGGLAWSRFHGVMKMTAIKNWSFFSVDMVNGLFRRAMGMTGSEADAWDLVQDTLERGLRRWREAPPADSGVRWLCVVLRNRHLDRVRSWYCRARLPAEPDLIDEVAAPEPAELPAWRTVDSERVERALQRLPPAHRQILLMQSRDRLSLREIADALRMPLATVGTRVHRARNKLRVLLQQDAPAA